MFTFNKNDIIIIKKTTIDTIFNLEYRNMRICQTYNKIVDLEKEHCIIDDVSLFINYVLELETNLKSPIFENYIDDLTQIPYVKITFPYSAPFKKKSANIIINLPQVLSSLCHQEEIMNSKIQLLEKKIADDFVIPYCSPVCESEINELSPIDDILKEVNKKIVKFCKEQYYIENSDHFEFLHYKPEDKKNKLIVLCDKENKQIVKYGCIYYCSFENKKINIIRFIDYNLLKTIMEINAIEYDKFRIKIIVWHKPKTSYPNIQYELHKFYIEKLHYYKNNMAFSKNFIDTFYSNLPSGFIKCQQEYNGQGNSYTTTNTNEKLCTFAFQFNDVYTSVYLNHVSITPKYNTNIIEYLH